jgi:hypothetical protein
MPLARFRASNWKAARRPNETDWLRVRTCRPAELNTLKVTRPVTGATKFTCDVRLTGFGVMVRA